MTGLAQRIADDAIHFERIMHAPIERVWQALTTDEGLRSWIGPATVELHAGGAFTLQLSDKVEMRGRVLEVDPPRRLLIHWYEIEDGKPKEYGIAADFHSELLFTLAPVAEGTKLTLTHRLIRGGEIMTSFASGWHALLDQLDAVLQGDSQFDAMATFERMKPLYDQRFAATS